MDAILLTKKEFQVLNLLWNSPESLTLHEILEKETELNRNTLQAVLRRLLSMGLLVVDGYGFNKTSLTRKFKANISQAQFIDTFANAEGKYEVARTFISTCEDPAQLTLLKEELETRLAQLSADGIQEVQPAH